MTSNAQPPSDGEAYWRRPVTDAAQSSQPPTQPEPPDDAAYLGPPRPGRPPFGWRPPTVVSPSAPRKLPPQDHADLDQRERAAKTLTNGVALVAMAVMFVLLLLFCGRWLF